MGTSHSQEEQQSHTQFQLQSQHHQQQQQQPQPQPQPHEPARRESWSLSSEGNTKSSKNTTKMVNNATTQSSMSVKPWNFQGQIPHNYEHILKDADSPVANSSNWGNLLDQLYAGVFLAHRTKKYWVEKKSNSNCFVLYARALSITWAENQNYWTWEQKKEESGSMIELAKLKMVCWLEVNGKFDMGMVSPGVLYQVSFIVMLKDSAEGWEIPINVRLVLPGGRKQEKRENLMDKSRERWIEIGVGEFVASEKDAGQMEISMYEYEGGMWKTGLLIQALSIKPKN